jgi:DNA-binding IclR family transcriptional regulator
VSGLTALGKASAIVDALRVEKRLSRIAAAAGLPVSTTHRILDELAGLGWVRREDRGVWVLSEGAPRRGGQVEGDLVRVMGDALASWCRGMGWSGDWLVRLRPYGAARAVLHALETHGYLSRPVPR